ncbi:sensor histidine kinase [Psychrobacillus psychrodurans]|uniref:histidine kinase n=1 Tax=Psychrobacillus psychrodurans TaxID=126157 RepID=A0A9X3R7U9_9BACI|nr:HAMP domain-containing sensor histidine kinase [Psychrobacillus psychrodurans]MCZ8531915.1 HAMP domain-containing histidine kinase [Psychrobacillus psychrodurans]
MKYDKYLLLTILQFIMIIGLLFIDLNDQLIGLIKGTLFILLFSVTFIHLILRLRSRARLKHMIVELRRAIKGNFKTRLLAQDNSFFDEVVFSVNELIEQLEKVQIQSIKSQTARRSLLSSISHDIRTPLTSIIGYIDALQDDIATSEKEKQEYLVIISKKADSLKQLIDEIFDMAKLDADEISLKVESLNLAEIARELLIEFLPKVKNDHTELHISIPEKKCFVIADRLSLMRIIRNIIQNALEHGKDGKTLGIELIEKANEYQLLIWDQGPGIPKENLEFVFERMYRGDLSRTLISAGSGLGLSIAKALVEKNQGEIWVESIPWQKTTFGFSIPRQNNSNTFKK